MISTSEIRISVIMRANTLSSAVKAVHTAFGLDGDSDVTVYAGTGR
jgi:aspartate kinase